MSDKLIPLYKSILRFSGLDADDNGFVSTILDNRREPALIGGMRLVLPTETQLRSTNPSERVVFHPLSENILRGESEVIEKLTEVINIRLNFTFGIIGQSLLNLVDSPDLHKRLNSQQMQLMIAIKEVDQTTLTNFINVMLAGIKTQPSKVFVNIFLNQGGCLAGQRHSRVGVVSFPVFKEVKDSAESIFGVKIRVKDRATFQQLYKFVFPSIVNGDEYSCFSDSRVAPYLDVLMKSAMGLASNMNDLLLTFKDFIEDAESLMFDSDWVQDFENLETLLPDIRRIPVQAGNEGKCKLAEVVGKSKTHQIVKPELPTPPAQQQPVAAMPAPPQQTQPPVYNPWQDQSPQSPAPAHQAQPPQTSGVVKTQNGLDFNSIMATNPGAPGMPSMYPGYPQPPQQMAPTPRWAMPTQPQVMVDQYNRPYVVGPQGQPMYLPPQQQPMAPQQMSPQMVQQPPMGYSQPYPPYGRPY